MSDLWITKEQAKESILDILLRSAATDGIWIKRQHALDAIDALSPIKVDQDAVSRKAVRDLAMSIKAAQDLGQNVASELRSEGKKVTHIKVDFLKELTKLPSVLPVEEPGPDHEAIVKGIEGYMCKEEYRLRTEGYAIVRGASRGKKFLKELKARHTPQAKEEKPEEKDD